MKSRGGFRGGGGFAGVWSFAFRDSEICTFADGPSKFF